MKTIVPIIAAVLLSTVAGCASGSPNDEAVQAGTESALSTSASAAKKAIKQSIALFAGGDEKRTHAIKLEAAPSAIAPALKKAHTELVKEQTGDDGFASSEKDVDQGVYEIFKSKGNHTVIAYAVWAYADNGDAGWGMVRGFDLSGHEIVRDEDSWAED